MNNDTLIPYIGVVTDIRQDTPDVKTFRVVSPEGGKVFEHMPGQCAMLSIPGVGEAMFSITSSPTNKEFMEFSIKKCGCLTEWLHAMDVGQQITIRGPYGNAFPVEGDLKGKDLLFIAGGIGLAPLRSVINYVRDNRANYGDVQVIYGSRSKDDLVDYQEIIDEWMADPNIQVNLTIDNAQEGWDGHVTCRFKGTWFHRDSGLHHYGASYEVRCRKVRTLQYRQQVCLQGRTCFPFRSA